jgi:outer membrane lipase/esterase
MSRNWSRRAMLLAACAASLLLAACGSGTIESQLAPTRIVVFGDAFADLGQNGSRYTVNDGTANNWTEKVAVDFGVPLTASSRGGKSYATAHARVVAKPDAVGNNATPTVKEQIDRFMASDAVGANDLYILNAGTSDLIAEGARFAAGGQTADQLVANARQAGRDLATQVRRLVNAGAKFVVVVGPYNLGRSPWGQTGSALAGALENGSGRFNDDMLIALVDLGDRVLYVDAALQFNLMISSPTAYEMTDAVKPVCTSVDPGPGIGIGAGQVNSALCTPTTVIDPAYNNYLFADKVYPTPRGHFKFGEYASSRIRGRW